MRKDLDTPLGQDRPPRVARPRRLTRSTLLTTLAVGTVLLAAAYTAWLPAPLETPAPPESTATAASSETPPRPSADEAGLPATDRAALQPGASSADIRQTVTDDGVTVTTFSPGTRASDGPLVLRGQTIGQDMRVAHIPEPHLLEDSPYGVLPTRGPEGERPMDAYARGWSGARGTRIAIVVGGLGLSQTGTQYAIEQLPEEVTLAFAESGNSLQRWMQEARRGGHELILQVPFEPFDYPNVDPGANTLTVEAGAEENLESLARSMARMTNYTGLMNYMGGRFMADADALEPVMRDLAARGLLFLDDGTSSQSQSELLARTIGVPHASADIVLDAVRERGAILERLDTLERAAVRSGTAIGVASAFDVSVDAIADWVREASARNIEIVGVSALVDDPERP